MPHADQAELTEFIEKHATPYDPETDTYRRAPFAQSVKAGKNSRIYNAHSYHTKVPPEGIVPYIEHYTDLGDLILDPFCGSGMTGVAALMTGRYAILNDLSPAAVHIARNYTTPVDGRALRKEFERIKAAVKEEFEWLYGTTCDRCGGPAVIHYTVWSDVFVCGRCGNEIVLWDVAVDRSIGHISKRFLCPSCGKEQTKLGLERLPEVPVLTNCECKSCKPKRETRTVTDLEKRRIREIRAEQIPYWIPSARFDPNGPQYRRNALSSRGIQRITDLYTERNLWAFARLWHESQQAQDPELTHTLHFGLTAINSYINRKQSYGGGGGGLSGMIYIPSFTMEKNVLLVLERKIGNLAKHLLSRKLVTTVCTNVGSATHLESIGSESTDYVFTDPPFGSNIYYSEVNLPWEAWLGEFTDTLREAVVHRKQDGGTKRLEDYAELMSSAFSEMYRVLKPSRWASVVFHNSDDRIWQVILDATENAGFELAEVNAFDKVQLTFKGAQGEKGLERVTNQDIVLNLRKPRPGYILALNGRADVVEAEQRVVETVASFLASNPSPDHRTLQHLWNHVLYDMLREGSVQVSMADVDRMLTYHSQTFKLVDGRYYLRGEAVLGGNVFDLRSDAGAIAWLTAVLGNEPQTTGELIPTWQQETAALGGVDPGRLDRLLEQNFWQDRHTGRWRLPTEAEREQMSARAELSAQAHLRVVRRFLDGELDRQPSDRELCAWLRFCYSREFYAEGAALLPHIVEARVDPEEYRVVKRMAAVCRMRAQREG